MGNEGSFFGAKFQRERFLRVGRCEDLREGSIRSLVGHADRDGVLIPLRPCGSPPSLRRICSEVGGGCHRKVAAGFYPFEGFPTLKHSHGQKQAYALGGRPRKIRDRTNRMRNNPKSTCAIHEAVPAMPPKPKTAAMSATTRNVRAQLIIYFPLLVGRVSHPVWALRVFRVGRLFSLTAFSIRMSSSSGRKDEWS